MRDGHPVFDHSGYSFPPAETRLRPPGADDGIELAAVTHVVRILMALGRQSEYLRALVSDLVFKKAERRCIRTGHVSGC